MALSAHHLLTVCLTIVLLAFAPSLTAPAEGHHSRHGNLSTVVGEVDGDADEEGRNVPPFAEWSG